MRKIIIILSVILLKTSFLLGQSKLAIYEDSLKNLGLIITTDTLEINRTQANYDFIKTLVAALKEKNSYYYPFNQLHDFISIKKSDDNKLKVFSWFTQANDGDYRYFGAIQVNNPNKLELYPLLDNSQSLKNLINLNDTTLQTNKWLGAVYYQIVPVTGIREPYYLLLGWKGKSALANSKVIETLKFVNDKPVFGTQVLESGAKTNTFNSRHIFDYTKSASMMLRYVKSENLIVFDHLVAPSKKAEGISDLYAPDLSYDGFKLKQGKWIFQENMKLKNLPDEADEFFIDPALDAQNTNSVIKE
ncbi:hypothetical protein [Pedobacter alpinus]|uniref:Uncharacterized protein n=1 Tax=Pedobacter alpinus TaxID=1590643 RepID=A0ABW5TV15_9SPHI